LAAETKEEKKRPRFSEAWREARELIWVHRHRLALGLLLMIVNRLAALVLPGSSKYLIDEVFTRGRHDMLLTLALAAGAATVVQGASSFALSQILGVAAHRAINSMRKNVQAHVSRLPVRFFDSTQTGVLISRTMSDADGIRNLVGTGLVQLAGGIMTALVSLGILFCLNWKLTLVTLSVLLVFGGAMAYAFSRLRPVFRQRAKINAEVTGRLSESYSGIRVVKAYTAEKREQIVFAKGAHRLFRNVATSITGVSAITAFSTLIVGVVGVLMISIGGRAVLDGSMTQGDFMMYILFTGLMAAPVIEMASIGTQITEAFAGLDRIRELKKLAAEDAGDATKAGVPAVSGSVRFDSVGFEYSPGVPVLKNISFDAPPGSTTALVGPSGSGKSTLVSLIMGFNQPASGRLLIDGRDLSGLKLREFRSHLGIVLQDNFLFDGSISENIAFARPHATLEQIRAASRVAHCDEFIEAFEKKYDTIVGERGVRLSGGQRQRVAIARAILADPKLLILDEATSSLDSESEALIQDGLRALRHGRTSFIIAHRLSTIRSADQILVLDAGEIVERGTHAELLQKNGRYKQLHDKQFNLESDAYVNPGEELARETQPILPAFRGHGQTGK
jgi:subfamily B ATP-binding cassette protein MsbA